jgi:crossover junction endodeoxyribonuclease RuvC
MLAAYRAGVEVREYTPLQVKQAITSFGRADKRQVQEMVRALLNLREIPRPDDAADGLAIAITHAFSSRMSGKVGVGK